MPSEMTGKISFTQDTGMQGWNPLVYPTVRRFGGLGVYKRSASPSCLIKDDDSYSPLIDQLVQ